MSEDNHFRRILILWAALSVVATPIVVLVAAPGLSPGKASTEASSQVADNTVLLGIATPITTFIVVYFAYTLIVFRRRDPDATRPYRAWGYPVVPAIFVLVTIYLIGFTIWNAPIQSLIGLLIIASGLPVYWYFARRNRSTEP